MKSLFHPDEVYAAYRISKHPVLIDLFSINMKNVIYHLENTLSPVPLKNVKIIIKRNDRNIIIGKVSLKVFEPFANGVCIAYPGSLMISLWESYSKMYSWYEKDDKHI